MIPGDFTPPTRLETPLFRLEPLGPEHNERDYAAYPLEGGALGASVSSWVRASHAELDTLLWKTVSEWLASAWPFEHVEYAPRGSRSTGPAAPCDQA